MRPLTAEWVQKAEGDLATAHRELRARRAPNYDPGESADKTLARQATLMAESIKTAVLEGLC
jgi:hypothetical protein